MILSAGLTPAWQQILVFDGFRRGEVNRAAEARWCTAGKALNAAIAVRRLGLPSLALAAVGGAPRVEIERELDAEGVAHRWVVTESATRVCTTVIDRRAGEITELVENGRPVRPEELAAFRDAYAEEAARAQAVILIGSLPAGVPASYYRELVLRTPCPAVLDFRGEGLLSVLDLRPAVVKPNREELAQTAGRSLEGDADLLTAMHDLNRRGAGWVVVSQGGRAVWLTTAARAWRVYPRSIPQDEIASPIGCGDVLAAALAAALGAGGDVVEGARVGVAAAATSLRQYLPARLDPARIAAELAHVRVEEVTTTGLCG